MHIHIQIKHWDALGSEVSPICLCSPYQAFPWNAAVFVRPSLPGLRIDPDPGDASDSVTAVSWRGQVLAAAGE